MTRTSLVLALLAVSCGSKEEAKPEPAKQAAPTPKPERPAPETRPAEPEPAPTGPDLGACTITLGGAFDETFESPGSTSRVVSTYWNDLDGELRLIINCTAGDRSISIVSGGKATRDTIPFGPKTYTLVEKGRGDLKLLAGVGKTSLVGATGTVDITAFDADHIAGTIDLTTKTLPDTGAVTIKGSFDYRKP